MKIKSKNLSDTRVEITVTLDADDLAAAKSRAVSRLAKDLKVDGFRKGKVPDEVAAKHLKPNELHSTTLDIAVRTSVPRAFAEASKQPLVVPEISVNKFVPDEMAEYSAVADIVPEVKLGNYKKLKAKKLSVKTNPKDVDEVIANIRNAYAEKKVARRAAKLGDEVIIDFTGTKDGVEFAGGSAKDHHLTLGSGQFIPGFEDGIVGHAAGDRFDLPLTFPKDYHNQELAGHKANFSVLVKQVNEVKLPALDDKLAKKCGPFKTVAELKSDIKKNLAAQNDAKATEKYKDDLVAELVKISQVAAPEVLIKDQLRFIKEDIANNAKTRGLTFEDYIKQIGSTEKDWEKEAAKVAEIRVKSSLVLQVLAREEQIEVTDDAVDAKLAELRTVYAKSPDALKQLKDPAVRQDLKNRLTVEKVLDYLVEVNSK